MREFSTLVIYLYNEITWKYISNLVQITHDRPTLRKLRMEQTQVSFFLEKLEREILNRPIQTNLKRARKNCSPVHGKVFLFRCRLWRFLFLLRLRILITLWLLFMCKIFEAIISFSTRSNTRWTSFLFQNFHIWRRRGLLGFSIKAGLLFSRRFGGFEFVFGDDPGLDHGNGRHDDATAEPVAFLGYLPVSHQGLLDQVFPVEGRTELHFLATNASEKREIVNS